MENNNNFSPDEYEAYPMGQITQAQARQLLARRYWNYEKIDQWVESLPQIQDMKKNKNGTASPMTDRNDMFPDD